MISFYKWKKTAILMLMGIVPLIVFLLMLFSMGIRRDPLPGFPGLYYNIINPMGIAAALAAAVVIIIIIYFLGNRLLRHAFTDMLEGKGLLTFVLDSTGLIHSFNVKVNAPKMEAIPQGKIIGSIEDIYDTDLMHRLMIPKDIDADVAYRFEQTEDGIKLSDPVNVIVLPETDDKYDKLFSFMNRPVFIFNKVMNKFLSRDALAKYEKDIEIKHNALNILRKVQETDVSFRNFGRYVGENIKPTKGGLFGGSNIVKWIILAAVIGIIIMIILMFIPGFLSASSNIGTGGLIKLWK